MTSQEGIGLPPSPREYQIQPPLVGLNRRTSRRGGDVGDEQRAVTPNNRGELRQRHRFARFVFLLDHGDRFEPRASEKAIQPLWAHWLSRRHACQGYVPPTSLCNARVVFGEASGDNHEHALTDQTPHRQLHEAIHRTRQEDDGLGGAEQLAEL